MKATGIGYFVNKPTLQNAGNSKVSKFRLVFDEKRKSKDGSLVKNSHFFDFEIWDRAAELVVENFDKGDTIYIVQATPREDKWQDKETGQNRSRVVFRIDEFSFVPRPSKEAEERFRSRVQEKRTSEQTETVTY